MDGYYNDGGTMRTIITAVAVFAAFMAIVSCAGKFDNTVWECKYDYKEYQDHMTGTNVLEFLPGGSVKGTFSNPGPLPPSVYIYRYTIEGNKIICTHSDVDTRVFIIKDGKLESEDGHCIYVQKQVAATAKGAGEQSGKQEDKAAEPSSRGAK